MTAAGVTSIRVLAELLQAEGYEVVADLLAIEDLGFEVARNGSKENVLRRCAGKIKHGRFSLYACVGCFVQEYSELDGYLSQARGIKFSNVPNSFERRVQLWWQ